METFPSSIKRRIKTNNSSLYDEKTFYKQFISDLQNCNKEVIIESPFITSSRMNLLFPILASLSVKGFQVFIITRNPNEHEWKYVLQSELELRRFENAGIQVLLCDGNHHRKLAIIDREIMRRIKSKSLTCKMFNFLKYTFNNL